MNTGMIELNILGIILFALLIFHGKTAIQQQQSLRFFYAVLFFLILMLVAKTLLSFVRETNSDSLIFIHHFLLITYALFSIVSAFCWLVFVHETVCGAIHSRVFFQLSSSLPLLIWCMLFFCAPLSHLVFVVNQNNQSIQGSLQSILAIIVYTYIFISALIAFIQYKKTTSLEKRNLCFHLFFCALLPLLGKGMELIFPFLNTAIPSVLSAMLLLSLHILKNEILLDPLTQLYNRRKFQNYLIQNAKRLKQENLFLIFFDINHFKSINDNFGHIEGDNALILVAQTLRTTFSDTKAFLARYGGDEFVIILPKNEEEVLSYLNKVDLALEELSKNLPYILSLSVGYSIYGEDNKTTIEGLVQAADKKMYRDKQKKKNSIYE